MTDIGNVVSIALTASGISILSRETPTLPIHPTLKYASQKTRGEISLEVNRGFLSGRLLDYSLREFGLRRPLEMTDIGNVLKARNNMFWKCTNRTKQQQFNVSTCRGLHCKPAVPTLFSCPSFERNKTFSSAPSVAHMGATQKKKKKRRLCRRRFHCPHSFPLMNSISRKRRRYQCTRH